MDCRHAKLLLLPKSGANWCEGQGLQRRVGWRRKVEKEEEDASLIFGDPLGQESQRRNLENKWKQFAPGVKVPKVVPGHSKHRTAEQDCSPVPYESRWTLSSFHWLIISLLIPPTHPPSARGIWNLEKVGSAGLRACKYSSEGRTEKGRGVSHKGRR